MWAEEYDREMEEWRAKHAEFVRSESIAKKNGWYDSKLTIGGHKICCVKCGRTARYVFTPQNDVARAYCRRHYWGIYPMMPMWFNSTVGIDLSDEAFQAPNLFACLGREEEE